MTTDDLQPLERLTFATTPTPSRSLGARGELVWLPLSHLRIDVSYQRSIFASGRSNIRRMIEEFSWEKFGVLDVARRAKDVYAVIDGQHRATAALCHGGIVEVPCLVLQRSLEEEARAFAAINHNVTRINPLQSFRAAFVGGDPEAIAVMVACSEAAVTIARRPVPIEQLAPGETCALAAVRRSYKRDGTKLLVTALLVCRATDPMSGLPGIAVEALCEMAREHPDWHSDAVRVGERIAATGGGMKKLVDDALVRRASRGGSPVRNFAAVVTHRLSLPALPAPLPGSALAAPTMAQLMGRR